ncbi:MAG: FtsK/SpoIIIE domain-containing protein [Rhodoluna sp.]
MRWFALIPGLLLGIVMAMVTGMWQFALFTFVSVLSAALTMALMRKKKREPDLDFSDQPLWVSSSALAIGDKLLPKSGWFFKEQYSDVFFDHFTRLAADREVTHRTKELEATFYQARRPGILPFWAGVSDSNNLEFDLVTDGPHCLIVGSTGSGKSEFLKLITSSLLAGVKAGSLQLVLVDFKGGAALRGLNDHPSSLTMVTDLDEGRHERFWLYLAGELKRRERILAEASVSAIDAMPNLARLLVLADELPAIISSHPQAIGTLDSIAARGRSLGVHLIATSQSLSGIPRALITNLTMRFALGSIDPGDLMSLLPSIRSGTPSNSRAIAIWGSNTCSFDFPMSKSIPNLGEDKTFPELVKGWSHGLPLVLTAEKGLLGVFDVPSQHRFENLYFEDLNGSSVLVVGAIGSGKSTFCQTAQCWPDAIVLDCPTIEELEKAFQQGRQIFCAMSSSFLMPLSMQRKFESIIYLRQGNLDQHIAAGLPKNQWSEKLPPGRGWFKNLSIQLAMPAPLLSQQTPAREHQLQAG